MAVIHEPKKRNVLSVAPYGCPERKWPRDGDKRVPSWPAFVVGASLVLIAAVIVFLFVLPAMLSSVLP